MSARASLALCAVAIVAATSCASGDEGVVTVTAVTPNAHVALSTSSSDAVAVLRTFDAFRSRLTPGGRAWSGGKALTVRLPTTERPTLGLSVEDEDALSLEIATDDDARVPAERVDHTVTLAGARRDTDVVHLSDAAGAEELRLLRTPAAPTLTRYRITFGPGIASLRLQEGKVQALDARGIARIESAPMFAVDARGTHRALSVSLGADGHTVSASLDATGLSHPIAVDPSWTTTGSMTEARDEHRAVRLKDGRVFVLSAYGSTAELYDPGSGSWKAALSLTASRFQPVIAALASGKVLVAGGTIANAQTYDPVTNTWAFAGTPPTGTRDMATLTTLASGKVLLAGGYDVGAAISTAAVYDPSTNGWTAVASMAVVRNDHEAVLLASGKVLVACGSTVVSSAETYDPVANKWSPAGTYSAPHKKCNSVLLPSGRVWVLGDGVAEVYNPVTNAWAAGGSTTPKGNSSAAALLPTGKVLIAGGTTGAYIYTSAAEIWDPVTAKFTAIDNMGTGRGDPAGVALLDGRILVSGGKTGKGLSTATVEVYGGALGAPCTSDDFCGSGHCTEGVCCSTATCPAGSSCKTPEKPGTCATTGGIPCTKPADCASGFCVDGLCCNSACTGQCEACDTDTAKGSCSPVSGAPHGLRAKCDAGAGDVCAARACDGAKDRTKCVGYVSGAAAVCKPGSCIGSTFIGPSTCDGTGGCATPKEVVCDPYACTDTGCRTACTADTDCIKGYTCKDGKCSATDAECIGGGAQSRSKDGKVTDCKPYRCTSSQLCGTQCASSADCLAGYVCDPGSKACIDPNATTGESGGCQAGRGDGEGGAFALLGLLLLSASRRRR